MNGIYLFQQVDVIQSDISYVIINGETFGVRKPDGQLMKKEEIEDFVRTFTVPSASLPTRQITKKPFIGIMGYARSGKDTIRGILEKNHGYYGCAFADKVREIAQCNDAFFPNLNTSYNKIINEYGYDKAKENFVEIRAELVKVGESYKHVFGDNFWVDRLFESINSKLSSLGKTNNVSLIDMYDGICISDCRHKCEYDAIKRKGGIIWKIKRSGVLPANLNEQMFVDENEADLVISNDVEIEQLEKAMESLLILSCNILRKKNLARITKIQENNK